MGYLANHFLFLPCLHNSDLGSDLYTPSYDMWKQGMIYAKLPYSSWLPSEIEMAFCWRNLVKGFCFPSIKIDKRKLSFLFLCVLESEGTLYISDPITLSTIYYQWGKRNWVVDVVTKTLFWAFTILTSTLSILTSKYFLGF